LATIASTHLINLNNGWPTKTGSELTAAEAFALLAQEEVIQANLVSLKAKMQEVGIYIWTKGTIENHLGCVPKNEVGWADFNLRLERENLDIILPDDHIEITDLVMWLIT